MMCVLKLEPLEPIGPMQQLEHRPCDEVAGWIIGTDVHDLRCKAYAAGDYELAQELYRFEFVQPGKHVLRTNHVLLVS